MKAKTILAGIAALTFCLTLTAHAQQAAPAGELPAAWRANIGVQLAKALASPNRATRQEALHLVSHLALQYGDQLTLSKAVPALVAIYRKDADPQNRLAAAAGLHAIGDEHGMQQLRQALRREEAEQVQYVTLALLLDFYGPETFAGDKATARMAARLQKHYLRTPAPVVAVNQ